MADLASYWPDAQRRNCGKCAIDSRVREERHNSEVGEALGELIETAAARAGVGPLVLVSHAFVIGWIVRETIDAPPWRWLRLRPSEYRTYHRQVRRRRHARGVQRRRSSTALAGLATAARDPGRRCASGNIWRVRGCSSMAEHQLPKLTVRVRFPSPARS
jgi:hypothetical protein